MEAGEPTPGRRRTATGRQATATTDEAHVLRQGLEAFAELGYEGTTVRELAKRLGVSHNYINDRYQSKFGFWRAVIDVALERMSGELTVLGEGHSDEHKLTAAVTDFCRASIRTPEINRIVADESARESERIDYLFEKYIHPFWSQLAPVVQRLIEAGRVPPAAMDVIFFTFTGPAISFTQESLARRLGRAAYDDTAVADEFAGFIIRGLMPASNEGDA